MARLTPFPPPHSSRCASRVASSPISARFSNIGKNLGGKEVPERIAGGKINADLLPVLGVQPILGRMFSADEDHPGGGASVILSHALWSTRFASRPDVLGKP